MRILRLLAVLPVVAAFTIVGSATHVGPAATGCVAAAGSNHAALVVEHGSGAVIAECVAFTADQVTGEQLLQLAQQQHGGVPEYATVDYGSYGKAVCQIDNEPTSYPPSCWTASSPYWALFVSRGGGAWSSSSQGISSQTFRDGDAEGFRYEGQSDQSTPPSSAGVCPPPTPPPTATVAPTGGPGPSSSATSRPSATGGSASPPATGVSAASPAPSTAPPPLVGQSPSSPGSTAHPSPTASPATATPSSIAGVVAAGPKPPAPAPPAGAVAALCLGVALVGLLAYRALRGRRRPLTPTQP